MADWMFEPKYRVEVPYRTELGSWTSLFTDLQLSIELSQWIRDHVGSRWTWHESMDSVYDKVILSFWFEDETAAALFKLTWS